MFALIYDTHELDKPKKRVISTHDSRKAAEKALEERIERLGKTVEECDTRIVWVNGQVKARTFLRPSAYTTWRPGEKIPWGDQYSDSD